MIDICGTTLSLYIRTENDQCTVEDAIQAKSTEFHDSKNVLVFLQILLCMQ